jgi:hypothetical protein
VLLGALPNPLRRHESYVFYPADSEILSQVVDKCAEISKAELERLRMVGEFETKKDDDAPSEEKEEDEEDEDEDEDDEE